MRVITFFVASCIAYPDTIYAVYPIPNSNEHKAFAISKEVPEFRRNVVCGEYSLEGCNELDTVTKSMFYMIIIFL